MGGLAIISSRFYFFSPLLLSSLSLFFFSFLFFSLLFVYIHIFPLLTHNNNNHHLINMSHQHDDDDFGPSENSNYKVGQKKSLNDYQNLDADDEALRRWKESLGVASTGGKLIFTRERNARTHRWLTDLFVCFGCIAHYSWRRGAQTPLPCHPLASITCFEVNCQLPARFQHFANSQIVLIMPLSLTLVSKLDDPHNVVVLQLALEVTGRPDVILDLTKSGRALSLITLFFFCSFISLFLLSIYYLLLVKKERESVWNGHLGEIPGHDRHSRIHIYSSVFCTLLGYSTSYFR